MESIRGIKKLQKLENVFHFSELYHQRKGHLDKMWSIPIFMWQPDILITGI